MRLLILTQYFPPEIGAPQNRLFELARHLQESGVEITVLTAMPNYPQMKIYEGYRGKRYMLERMHGMDVHRTSIYVSENRSVVSRLRNYFSFVMSSARSSSRLPATFDFLLCESPPLFLGYAALYLARKKKARLIFNVSDLWPESAEKLGVVTSRFLLKRAYALEARLYRRAALVTGQTQGICSNISARFPGVKTWWLPNGADLSFFDPDRVKESGWRDRSGIRKDEFVFLYAGIVGLAQGLDIILDCAAEFRERKDIRFVIMGSGPDKQRLQEKSKTMDLPNVLFLDAITKAEMPSVLHEVYAAIVPLRKLDLFLGAIPSKIFENLAMKVPLLLGVDGEARKLFIEDGKCGIFFEPGQPHSLADGVRKLLADAFLRDVLGSNGRDYVMKHFNRAVIAANFYKRLKEVV